MENPVCALVEKQFVTTLPGAVEFQLIGRVFIYAGRADRAAQAWGHGLWASSGHFRWGGGPHPRWPLVCQTL